MKECLKWVEKYYKWKEWNVIIRKKWCGVICVINEEVMCLSLVEERELENKKYENEHWKGKKMDL